jgi:hypothetical protein
MVSEQDFPVDDIDSEQSSDKAHHEQKTRNPQISHSNLRDLTLKETEPFHEMAVPKSANSLNWDGKDGDGTADKEGRGWEVEKKACCGVGGRKLRTPNMKGIAVGGEQQYRQQQNEEEVVVAVW